MSMFFKSVKEILFRLRLYLTGIRFYEQVTDVNAPVIYEAEYRLDSNHRIKFKFYRVQCIDIVLKRGKLVGEDYASFVVQAFLDENFPDELRKFNEKSFFFNGKINSFGYSEQQSVELILDVYLDFLKSSLAEAEKSNSN